MGRKGALPIILEDCMQINLSDFKRWGYLRPNQSTETRLRWERLGHDRGSVTVTINIHENGTGSLLLRYNFAGRPVMCSIGLVAIPSNLRKGVVWFFECPETGERCRKLYLIHGGFRSRKACTSAMYYKQIYSKWDRAMDKIIGRELECDRAFQAITEKHVKRTYRGKTTKRYASLYRKLTPDIQSFLNKKNNE